MKNKHGLDRQIPGQIKREIRQSCGYGCVICGNAIYQYEHIDPPFSDAKTHDPDKIALLCGACHDNVTRGIWSKKKVIEARRFPKTKEQGFSSFSLDIKRGSPFTVKVGSTKLINLQKIIEIDGKTILGVKPPEKPSSPPLISAILYDRNNNEIASVVDNEWYGSTESFDIETKGRTIKIRSAERMIDLFVKINPPNEFVINTLNLSYNGKAIQGSNDKGFKVLSGKASAAIPPGEVTLKYAPHWISVKDNKISVGTDSTLNPFEIAFTPASFEVESGELEIVDQKDSGNGWIEQTVSVTDFDRAAFSVNFDNTTQDKFHQFGEMLQSVGKAAKKPEKKRRKIGRNEPCPCGSGKKYKKCHG